MSNLSQPTNNRSMNGIIEYDDGNGGILSGGVITANTGDIGNLNVDFTTIGDLQITDELKLGSGAFVDVLNGTQISDTEISYLDGVTSNIQTQINAIPNTIRSSNNTWTGINTYNNVVNFNDAVFGLNKNMVGLGNVDNTSDLNKPISTATQNALNTKLNINGGTASSLTINGTLNNLNGSIYCTQNTGLVYYLTSNGRSNISCAIGLAGYNAMVTDLYSCSDMRFRFVVGGVNTVQHQFNSDGSVLFMGTIGSPTINALNSRDNNLQAQINALLVNFIASNNTWTGTNQFNNTTTFVGNISANSTTITPTVLSRIANLTSDAQTQINNRLLSNFGTGNNLTINNTNIGGTTYYNGNQIMTSGNYTDYYLGSAMSSGTRIFIDASNNFIINHVASNIMFIQWGGVTKCTFLNDGSLVLQGLLNCPDITVGSSVNTVDLNITGTATGITKAMVGLGNVDNTSDLNKPVSTATQTALNLKANLASPTFSGNVSLPTTYQNGISYFRNIGPTIPPFVTNVFGAITTNYQSGSAEMDFWNVYGSSNGSLSAFRHYNVNADGTASLLMNILRSGNTSISGLFTSVGANFTAAVNGTSATFSGAVSAASSTITGALTGSSAVFSGAVSAASSTISGALSAANATFSNLVTSDSYTNTSGNWGVIPSGSVKTSAVVISTNTTYTKSNMPSIITNTSATGIIITIPADLDIGTEFTVVNLKLVTSQLVTANGTLTQFYSYVGSFELLSTINVAQYSTTYVLATYSGKKVWFVKSTFQYPSIATGKFGSCPVMMGNGDPYNAAGLYYLSYSNRRMNPSSVDDFFVVQPGYVLEAYSGINYTGTKSVYSNQIGYLTSQGVIPKFFYSDNINTMVSYKIFFYSNTTTYGEELFVPGFS